MAGVRDSAGVVERAAQPSQDVGLPELTDGARLPMEVEGILVIGHRLPRVAGQTVRLDQPPAQVTVGGPCHRSSACRNRSYARP